MLKRLIPLVPALTLALPAVGCKKGDDKPAEEKPAEAEPAKEEPAEPRDPGTSLDKVAKGPDLSGPVPPETSMVFFTVDGALIPVGCFDKDKGKLSAGKDCLKLAPKDADVYLKSQYSDQLDTIGEPKNALCEVGVSKPTSLATPATDSGAAFDWAASPKSAARNVVSIPADTWDDAAIKYSDDEKKAVAAAIAEINDKTKDVETNMHQAASVDLDGDGKDERLFSAYVVNPRDTARYLFSGVFVARGTAPETMILVEKTKTNSEIFKVRAAADLDGDGTHELWLNAAFDEGGGDRMYVWKGDKFDGLGKWTCGL
ncbi:MAG: hypothetical protein KC486_03890 [Myxococcales bacterium]|nr:hypothetical protein [Myxococcales bacterium]